MEEDIQYYCAIPSKLKDKVMIIYLDNIETTAFLSVKDMLKNFKLVEELKDVINSSQDLTNILKEKHKDE